MWEKEASHHGLLITVVFVCLSVTFADIDADCQEKTSCKECISFDPRCSWCGEVDKKPLLDPMIRCRLHSINVKQCKNVSNQTQDVISNPKSHVQFNRNEKITNSSEAIYEAIQLKPQDITVRLRKNQPQKVTVEFKKVIDYPLDIYYVMDLSLSMSDDLQKLQGLGTALFEDINKTVTENVQLGFGSFVDKVVMPFTSTVPDQLENPCLTQEDVKVCARSFGFHHQMSITNDSVKFAQAVGATRISANIDIPEGSFDALMQIAVCERIKWRPGATRVILLTTDASPHLAMDGKLAAILEANDMKCHLKEEEDDDGNIYYTYSKSKTMDYPSLGQLRDAFKKNGINSIFAVTEDVESLYMDFPTVLGDNTYVERLANDSSNIIPLINTTYNKIKGKLIMDATKLPDNVQATFRTFCPNETDPKLGVNGMQCDGINIDDHITFEIEFTATECPKDPNHVDTIVLSSTTLRDKVNIRLEYLCECDCQSEGFFNSSKCTNEGNLTCGLCECNSDRGGSTCGCLKFDEKGTDVQESCKMDPKSTKYCEDRGVCECGNCIRCEDGYIGDYCECKTSGCPSSGGLMCGGPEKGTCRVCPGQTERCRCIGNYSIKDSDKTCTCHPSLCKADETDTQVCNGRGNCSCDTCICTDPNWSGKFCDECVDPECTDLGMTCDSMRKCAECKSKRVYTECKEVCPESKYIVYAQIDTFPDCSRCTPQTPENCDSRTPCTIRNATNEYYSCRGTHSDGCSYRYDIVWRNDNRFHVYVKIENQIEDCPQPINIAHVVPPIVAGIVLIGLIALIAWKIIVTRRDRLQYEAFLEEEEKRRWTKEENPIFQQPEQKFANPMFQESPDN